MIETFATDDVNDIQNLSRTSCLVLNLLKQNASKCSLSSSLTILLNKMISREDFSK